MTDLVPVRRELIRSAFAPSHDLGARPRHAPQLQQLENAEGPPHPIHRKLHANRVHHTIPDAERSLTRNQHPARFLLS